MSFARNGGFDVRGKIDVGIDGVGIVADTRDDLLSIGRAGQEPEVTPIGETRCNVALGVLARDPEGFL